MKAVVQSRYGSTEVLAPRDIETPVVGAQDVLVRVRAAGVNPADWAVTQGLPYIARPVYGLPHPKVAVRGTDVAGVVAAVGSAVTRFAPGDEVFGSAPGAYAELVVATEETLAPKPAGLTFEQAAAVPLAGAVALRALRAGDVGPGRHVLVNGASGGIGTFAVQIAKALGAEVTGVCSAANVDVVRAIGADHVVDHTRDDFTRGGARYDVVLDNVGNHPLSRLLRVLTADGMLVPNAGQLENRWFASAGRVLGAHVLALLGRRVARPFVVTVERDDLIALTELIAAGAVVPVLDRTYPLSEAAAAVAHVGRGHARGKVVVTV
ncbi:NAD(P)-dependent alcohol dehydrogenase [Cellulomonas fimi]|uniref:NAD(P)-dependent alcohol dehydrogenase n=1 Tax=Cellulomonas fimi TaxID=1708 RepID=A0A7Y0LYU3_CELFI|nr:NAD(P)-dependent alcohol dehydrogenase [Cellulomonas fimi]NMR20696.1 NAD(P)-dependent alcohol dehydrogenase [Cellulomonas fimi]